MKTTNADRMEKVRKARSLNDIISIVKVIAKDVLIHKKSVTQMGVVTAAVKKISTDEIVIDHTGEGPSKIKKGAKKPKGTAPKTLGVRLEKFVAPPIEKLKKHSAIIHELHDNQMELDAAEAMIKQMFSRAKNKTVALNGVRALKAEVEDALADAYAMLNGIAHKHLPAELQSLKDDLVEFLLEHIKPTNYADMSEEIYVTVHEAPVASAPAAEEEDDGFDKPAKKPASKPPTKIKISKTGEGAEYIFSCYVHIDQLKNQSGFVFGDYFVILSGLVDRNGTLRFYLNTLPDFKPPGKYDIGAEVTTEDDMIHRATLLMAHNDIVTEFERKPMPLTTEDAMNKGIKNIKNVFDTFVLEDALHVTIKKGKATKETIDNIVSEVVPLLNMIVGNAKRIKSVIQWKKVKRNDRTELQFVLTPNIPQSQSRQDYSVNVQKLHELKKALGLPDEVVKEIQKVLKHHV